MQFAQEEIPLLFASAKDVLGGIESVVNERFATVAFGVVAREENGVGREWRAGFPIAVQRVNERKVFGPPFQRKMRVHYVGAVGDERRKVAAGILEDTRGDLDDLGCFGETRAGLGNDADPMTMSGEPANQRNDDALRSAIAFDRQSGDHDVHRSPSITSLGP